MITADFKLVLYNLVVVLIAILLGLLCKFRSERFKLNVIRTLAILIVVIDLSIVPYRVFTNYNFLLNGDLSTDLPIFFCDIIMLVVLVTFCGPRVVKFLVPFALWGAVLGGLFVLTDPNFYNPTRFFFDYSQFRSILTHSLMLVLFFFAVCSRYFKPQLKHMWNMLVCCVALLLYASAINYIFSFSVIAQINPGWQLNAIYMQHSPVPIAAATGPLIAVFMLILLFITNFLIELYQRKNADSVFSYYRTHTGSFARKTLGYFILDNRVKPGPRREKADKKKPGEVAPGAEETNPEEPIVDH